MGVTFSQFFPPSPTLTEANLTSQKGKVFIITGGASGVGLELCRILYHAGGTVYIAGRSEENANIAIKSIQAASRAGSGTSTTPGELRFLHVSLDDLTTIKPAVDAFSARETRLDVLFNNAGVSNPPQGSVSAQNHELQMATNCLGPYLLTQLLLPILTRTAQGLPAAAVRVVWLSSIAVEFAPKGGIDMANITKAPKNPQEGYTISKTGNWFLASQLASQADQAGILSLTVNPGNLKSNLVRHLPKIVPLLAAPLLRPPVYGAYSELWAGLSPNLSIKDGGSYVIPWGRIHPKPRPDLVAALQAKEQGGSGIAGAFVDWCQSQTASFR